jgi:hypothetical protein
LVEGGFKPVCFGSEPNKKLSILSVKLFSTTTG